MFTTKFLSIVLLCAASATAQPKITGGPANAASYTGPGRPNSSIAQGSIFIVFGQNMGLANLVQVNSLPVPATLGGTSIRVTVGGTTVNALMIYSSGGQVAAVLPSNTATGDGTLTLTFNNQTSAPAPIRVVPSSFGMFTRNPGGSGPAIVQNFISQTQQPTNDLIAAAQPGQTMILWGTEPQLHLGNLGEPRVAVRLEIDDGAELARRTRDPDVTRARLSIPTPLASAHAQRRTARIARGVWLELRERVRWRGEARSLAESSRRRATAASRAS